MSSQSEQDIARDYCHTHKLSRPKTNVLTLLVWLLFIELLTVGGSYLVSRGAAHWFDISLSYHTVYLVACIIIPLFFARKLCIVGVELYQHYAPEEIRRKCICMPTCSEYAILVLKKHRLPKALFLIYNRLTKTCKGDKYVIDHP